MLIFLSRPVSTSTKRSTYVESALRRERQVAVKLSLRVAPSLSLPLMYLYPSSSVFICLSACFSFTPSMYLDPLVFVSFVPLDHTTSPPHLISGSMPLSSIEALVYSGNSFLQWPHHGA